MNVIELQALVQVFYILRSSLNSVSTKIRTALRFSTISKTVLCSKIHCAVGSARIPQFVDVEGYASYGINVGRVYVLKVDLLRVITQIDGLPFDTFIQSMVLVVDALANVAI